MGEPIICVERTVQSDYFLVQYLSAASGRSHPRVRCPACNASRRLYCGDCLKILAPLEDWPTALRDGSLSLPFLVDLVLDDRRAVSTGVHLATILNSMAPNRTHNNCSPSFRLFDVEFDDPIPEYQHDDVHDNYLLFPCPGSVPLSSIVMLPRIAPGDATRGNNREKPLRLIVLDCKWARRGVRLHPALAALQKVHLDDPPCQSHYWRWHNSGEGMLSTIEAVYYAAWQVGDALGWPVDRLKCLAELFWLFRFQRESIKNWYEHGDERYRTTPVPFTEAGKHLHRSRRNSNKQRSRNKSCGHNTQLPEPSTDLVGTD
jgi:DTW domain